VLGIWRCSYNSQTAKAAAFSGTGGPFLGVKMLSETILVFLGALDPFLGIFKRQPRSIFAPGNHYAIFRNRNTIPRNLIKGLTPR
jgi:hypothetical protein